MKQLVFRSLSRLGVPRAAGWVRRNRATILTYHGFTDGASKDDIENFHGLHLHVDMFRRHLEFLRERCNPISLDDFLRHLASDTPLPPRSVVLTFDDGYRSNYRLAFPLLREFAVPATIFLTTNFVDRRLLQWTDRLEYAIGHAEFRSLRRVLGREDTKTDSREFRGSALLEIKRRLKGIAQENRDGKVEDLERDLNCSLALAPAVPAVYEPLTWPEIEEMLDSGLVSIGAHTVSHFILSRCTPEVLTHELRSARRIIEERTGVPCPLFCYPNGDRGDFDERTREAVKAADHTCALTTVVGSNGRNADPYELKRLCVLNGQSFEDFVMGVSGITERLGAVGSKLRKVGVPL